MKKITYILVLLFTISLTAQTSGIGGSIFFGKNQIKTVDKQDMNRFYKAINEGSCRITFIGTSITEGRGAQSEKKNMWVNQFMQELIKTFPDVDFEAVNYGISSRRLEDYVNESFVAYAENPVDPRDGFSKETDIDAWQIPQVIGKSWRQHAEDSEPDLLIIHHGENDAGYLPTVFRGWLEQAIDDARSWAKPPSIVLATPMLGTQDDPAFVAANVFVEKYARLIRNVSVEKATGLIDFNRYWRLLRDGEDENITEYKYVKITDLTFRSGEAAETIDANTLENDSSTTETFYGTEDETYLEANIKCDFTVKASTGQLLFSVGAINTGTYLKALAIRITSSSVQIWERDDDLKVSNSYTFTNDVTYRFEAALKKEGVKIWVNETLVAEWLTPSNLGRGNLIVGVRNSLIDNVFIEGGKTLGVVTPKYPNNELLGSAAGAWESGDYSQGGNGLNHPSRVALMEAFNPAVRDFIGKL